MAEPAIQYVCVARRGDNAIIAQRVHTTGATNFLQYTKTVLSSPGWAGITTDKLTLSDGEVIFYVFIDPEGRAFIAITNSTYPSRYIYDSSDGRTAGFLTELQRRFVAEYGPTTLTCPADSYTQSAKLLLRDICNQYNDLRNIDKIAKVQDQLKQVSAIMKDNIDKVIDRGEAVDTLVRKSTALNEQAGRFESNANTLRKTMRCQNRKAIVKSGSASLARKSCMEPAKRVRVDEAGAPSAPEAPHAKAPSANPLENLAHLGLRKIIKENHPAMAAFVPNCRSSHAWNLAASLSDKQVNIYDNYHCGSHLDMVYQYNHESGVGVSGASLTALCWAEGADPKAVLLLLGTDAGEVLVLDFARARITQCLNGHTGAVGVLAGGNAVALSIANDNTMRLWNTVTMSALYVLDGSASAAAFLPDGVSFVTGSAEGVLSVWAPQPEAAPLPSRVAATGEGGIVSVTAVASGSSVRIAALTSSGVLLSVCGDAVMTGGPTSARRKGKRGGDSGEGVLCGGIALAPSGDLIVVGDSVGVLHVYDFHTAEEVHRLMFPRIRGASCGVMLAHDLSCVVFGTVDAMVWRWDLPYKQSEAQKTVEIVA